jgi:low temperature requirement protein LtrA
VFGLTQVTTLLSDNPTWSGLLHALLVLATFWWVWAAYAWLTNVAVSDELAAVPALALCCGPALYLFAYVALRARVSHSVGGGRLVAAVACAILIPVALAVPAIVALLLVAAVWISLHAYELIWWRAARAETRAQRVTAPCRRSRQ